MAEATQAQNSNDRARKTSMSRLSSTQIMFALILAVGLMLAIQFSSRITQDRGLQQMRDTVQQEIDLLRDEQVMLTDQLAFVESDAYVEAWARSEGRMVRDNEVLVLPIPSSIGSSPAPTSDETEITTSTQGVTIETTLPEPENWQLWWALFFDGPPPNFD